MWQLVSSLTRLGDAPAEVRSIEARASLAAAEADLLVANVTPPKLLPREDAWDPLCEWLDAVLTSLARGTAPQQLAA